MTTTTARPARATDCPECRGTGREVEVTEILDDVTDEVIGEDVSDYGPCEICDGRGWFPYETPAQRREREAAEQAEYRARKVAEAREHLAICPGSGCDKVIAHRNISRYIG
jgi:RecJ-like exonuclease